MHGEITSEKMAMAYFFDGKVTKILDFGAFVEFVPGREGMVHISELEWHRVEKVEDVLKPGDEVRVKLIKIDEPFTKLLTQGMVLNQTFFRESTNGTVKTYFNPSNIILEKDKKGRVVSATNADDIY